MVNREAAIFLVESQAIALVLVAFGEGILICIIGKLSRLPPVFVEPVFSNVGTGFGLWDRNILCRIVFQVADDWVVAGDICRNANLAVGPEIEARNSRVGLKEALGQFKDLDIG